MEKLFKDSLHQPKSAAHYDKPVHELFIDVSEYEHPVPFEKVMQLVRSMTKGDYIRMHHRKKPLPLIQLLQENGFDCRAYQRSEIPWEIIIWNMRDTDVKDYCLSRFSDSAEQ